ncbi:MAG: HopJ type III effector protein [Pseudomonadales bacterium]|nr:HopJ type III effector protein [Pseudomonadales bacterium]
MAKLPVLPLSDLLEQVRTEPDSVNFQQVMQTIENNYVYRPTTFTNGGGSDQVHNEAGTNEGSCKIFAFGLLNSLSESEVLACFGDYYRQDVLQNPDGKDHANIRSFMKHGWQGVHFKDEALSPR